MNPIQMLERRMQGRTLRALAKELGISAPYLSDIMNGNRSPGPKVLKALGLERETVTRYRKV